MTADRDSPKPIRRDDYKLVEPYDMLVSAHHGAVRLRLLFRPGQTSLHKGSFYGCEMTPEEARAMAAHMVREADLAERKLG